MDKKEVAKAILGALYIEPIDEYVKGIELVFETFENNINNSWELYLQESTNLILQYNNITCKHCGMPIQVSRSEDTVYVCEYDE
jgi:hypothetical protein